MVSTISIPSIPKKISASKNSFTLRTTVSISSWNFGIGSVFLGFGVGQHCCRPGEAVSSGANEHIAWARNHRHLLHVYMHVHTLNGRWFAPHQATTRASPKAWPVRRGHANARPPQAGIVMRRSLGGVQMQHRLHRHVYCGLLQHADAGALCAVLVLLHTRAVSEKSDRALGSGACDRPTRTPHSTPHANGVNWQPSHECHRAAAAAAAAAVFLNPHLASKPFVCSYFSTS